MPVLVPGRGPQFGAGAPGRAWEEGRRLTVRPHPRDPGGIHLEVALHLLHPVHRVGRPHPRHPSQGDTEIAQLHTSHMVFHTVYQFHFGTAAVA